ncbi:hypothetical protein FGO68_gene16700 [Halteria grandinella]|uniref:Uncharacterized protein n=1 Tax=Halteria grandinella TaxID=5974 RepID=A0A8J8P3J9_HALGN|nr:hypothetical protein FGO68_gene16700 [Halteria grandinella]
MQFKNKYKGLQQQITSNKQNIYMQALRSTLALVSILLSLLLQKSLQACTTAQAPYPKIVGGIQGTSGFKQIDYNQVNDYLVGAGNSNDQEVRGDALGFEYMRPIIITYQYNFYMWGKVLTSLVDHGFLGVKINRLGTRLVAANYDTERYLIVMDITNGNVIAATQLTTIGTFDNYRRRLLLLDNGNILMGDSTRIIKIAPPSISAPTYTCTLSGSSTIGLLTNTAQSYLHVFAFASSICMITVMDMATFTRVYQYQTQCESASAADQAQTFQSCIFETSATVDTIVFQEGTRFFKISNQYSPPVFTTSTVHDPQFLSARGLYCQSNELVHSLMTGMYSTDFYRIFVASVNFNTNKITYTRYLQYIGGGMTLFHGVIISANQFYLSAYSTTITKATSNTFRTRSISYANGLIFSPMLTCQSIEQLTYPVATLIVNSFTFTATTYDYTSSSTSVTHLTSLPPTSNIVQTEFEG